MPTAAATATARLRRTFKYPTDSDLFSSSDDDDDGTIPPDSTGLDDAQQDALIAQLRARDAAATRRYRALFLALAGGAALVLLLLGGGARRVGGGGGLQTGLALSSLGASAWLMYVVPVQPQQQQQQQQAEQSAQGGGRGVVVLARGAEQDRSPIERYLALLNGLLAGVLALSGVLAARRVGSEGDVVLAVLPLVIFVIIMVARSQLSLIDVEGLSLLKYDYKGA